MAIVEMTNEDMAGLCIRTKDGGVEFYVVDPKTGNEVLIGGVTGFEVEQQDFFSVMTCRFTANLSRLG